MTLEQFEIDMMNGDMNVKYGAEANNLRAAMITQIRGEAGEVNRGQRKPFISRLYERLTR